MVTKNHVRKSERINSTKDDYTAEASIPGEERLKGMGLPTLEERRERENVMNNIQTDECSGRRDRKFYY